MPLAVGAFMLAIRTLSRPGLRTAAAAGGAMLVSALAKPNYVLAFAPCLAVMLAGTLFHRVRTGSLRLSVAGGMLALVFGLPALALVTQALLLARHEAILYAPFAVWGQYCRGHFYGAVLVGVAFPLSAILCYPRQANASQAVVLAWATLAVAIAMFALFAESGERITHANFAWGMTFADHVLFVVTAAFLVRQPGVVRRTLCFLVLGLHALSGAASLRLYCE
jgi:hypothetical protein